MFLEERYLLGVRPASTPLTPLYRCEIVVIVENDDTPTRGREAREGAGTRGVGAESKSNPIVLNCGTPHYRGAAIMVPRLSFQPLPRS